MRLALKRHPDTRCDAVTAIGVDVARPRTGALVLSYEATGIIGGLHLPLVTAPTRTDELWRDTCFEVFIRPALVASYFEFNFAPSTQWAAYRFDDYRSSMHTAEIGAPRVEIESSPGLFTLRVALELESFPLDPWRVGLSAVIEESSGRLSYWALAHPSGKPDFHHADCFACQI
jgi:hypothetical protein